jgi:ABC-type sugar transport system permease subunit
VSTTVVQPTAGWRRLRRAHLTERARAERRLAAILIAPAAIVMLLVTVYPIITTFVLSLQRADLRFPNAGICAFRTRTGSSASPTTATF